MVSEEWCGFSGSSDPAEGWGGLNVITNLRRDGGITATAEVTGRVPRRDNLSSRKRGNDILEGRNSAVRYKKHKKEYEDLADQMPTSELGLNRATRWA